MITAEMVSIARKWAHPTNYLRMIEEPTLEMEQEALALFKEPEAADMPVMASPNVCRHENFDCDDEEAALPFFACRTCGAEW